MSTFARLLAALMLLAMSMTAHSDEFEPYRQALNASDPAAVLALMRADGGRWPVASNGQSLLHAACWRTPERHKGAMIGALLGAGAAVDARS